MSVSPQHLLRAITESGLLQASEQGALIAEARRARKDPLEVASARLRLPREVFYRALGDAGADRHRWGKHLRRDFEGFLKASRPFVKRMRGHFAEAPAPTF